MKRLHILLLAALLAAAVVPASGCDDDKDSAGAIVVDRDDDSIEDGIDNCPDEANTDQADADGDGTGDACDDDQDNDTIPNAEDNCPSDPNADQADADDDGMGDACDESNNNNVNNAANNDADQDADGLIDAEDNCPEDANPDQADLDGDDAGDACDDDLDGDAVLNDADNCPGDPNADQEDLDGDDEGDACDDDLDGDTIVNASDNCPTDPNTDQADLDLDDEGNACDGDLDGDAVANNDDNCPGDPNPDQENLDDDADGDACDSDLDGDAVLNDDDNCPSDPNADQSDLDEDTDGDACDDDLDGDAVANADDNCPSDPNADQNDLDEDTEGDACDSDLDGDTVPNDDDNCATVANADQADLDDDADGDACDDDLDGDTVPNEGDNCPTTPNADQGDLDEDTSGDLCDDDLDGDTVPNDDDNCPGDPNADQSDLDEDTDGDACDGDLDGDTVPNDDDNCATVANADQADLDADTDGDACDDDLDGDAVPNDDDNCLTTSNADQINSDEDPDGDACDDDDDDDTILDGDDNCRVDSNEEQTDADEDGAGDACDVCLDLSNPGQEDADGDGFGDQCDICPDAFDPEQLDSDNGDLLATARAIPFVYRQLNAPTNVPVTGDDSTTTVTLPFPVLFFGQSYTTMHVSTNGLVGFGDEFNNGCCSGQALPNPNNPNGLIALFWEDLAASPGNLVTEVQGTAPNREFILAMVNHPHLGGGSLINAQLVLHEDSEEIEIHCQSCPSDGGAHTQGVESPGGAVAAFLPGRTNTSFSLTNDGVRFTTAIGSPDGYGDACDVCPLANDPDQEDFDEDGAGDACDVCPEDFDPEQGDVNSDGVGDACQDLDEDTILDIDDNCPFESNTDQADGDDDGVGDACDNCPEVASDDTQDFDEDGVGNACDNCPDQNNPGQEDANNDGIGDACGPPFDCEDGFDNDNDGEVDEDSALCDNPPSVICGEPVSIGLGEGAELSASYETPNLPRLFEWRVLSAPTGSTARPSPTNQPFTFFRPDQSGEYTLRFTVVDANAQSASCALTVFYVGPLDCADGIDNDGDDEIDEDADGCETPPTLVCPDDLSIPTFGSAELEVLQESANPIFAQRWTVEQSPADADATPSPPDSPLASFAPDGFGLYTLRYTLTDVLGQTVSCEFDAIHEDPLDCTDEVDSDGDGQPDEDPGCDLPPTISCPGDLTLPVLEGIDLTAEVSDDGQLLRNQWFLIEEPVGSDITLNPALGTTTNFFAYLPGEYRVRFVSTDDQRQQSACEFTIAVIVEEDLRVEMIWDIDRDPYPNTDVDLHLLHPLAPRWFHSPLDCFYANDAPDWSDTTTGDGNPDNDPRLDVDDTSGRGPENIDIATPYIGQTYRVGAHYFSDHSEGTSDVIIRIYCFGQVQAEFGPVTLDARGSSGQNGNNDLWKVADVTFNAFGGCDITPLLNPDGSPQIISSMRANTER